MIKIDTAYFDFRMENEEFAHGLYGQWDGFCRVAFEKVVDDVLSKYDAEGEIVQFETVTLNLGMLPESEFYEKFPVLLTERLQDFFTEYLLGEERHLASRQINDKIAEWLLNYLLNGTFGWDIPDECRNLSNLLHRVITGNSGELVSSLRRHGQSEALRERLVLQFTDEELENVVAVMEPSDSRFICDYNRFLQKMYKRWKRPDITGGDYRNVVWLLVFAYLLHDGRDFFSRKQFVFQTIAGLAARYNVSFPYLLGLITAGLSRMMARQVVNRELLQILSEIQREQQQGKVTDEMSVLCDLVIKKTDDLPPDCVEKIRFLLAGKETCRRMLQPLQEEEIYRFVKLLIPAESDFVISYARSLEQGKNRDLFEGKAGSEFRLLKWEFLFRVLLDDPVSPFDRKRFVYAVLQQLAVHYNLDIMLLLEFFRQDASGLPDWLPDILQSLLIEQQQEQPLRLLEVAVREGVSAAERSRLILLLARPLTCRLLLTELPEEHICRLAELVCPAESPFMVAYAAALHRQKEQGMFEGKAGTDFRVVKWEFIFQVVLNRSFNRKQFVHTVLQQLALHYNLETSGLLDYFYRSFTGEDHPAPDWLVEVIRELRTEFVDMEPGSMLEVRERQYKRLRIVEDFMLTGISRCVAGDIHTFFVRLCREVPDEIRNVAEYFKKEYKETELPDIPGAAGFYAAFLLWEIRYYGLCFSGKVRLVDILQAVEAGRMAVPAVFLRQLAYYCLVNDTGNFQRILQQLTEPDRLTHDDINKALVEIKAEPVKKQASAFTSLIFFGLITAGRRKEVFDALESCPQTVLSFLEKGELDERQLFSFLSGDVALQTIWLSRAGQPVLRIVINELLELQKQLGFRLDERTYLNWLVEFTARRYINLSQIEILSRLWRKFREQMTEQHYKLFRETVLARASQLPQWKKALIDAEGEETGIPEVQRVKQEKNEECFYIKNAGLVLLSPWFPRLFSRTGLLDDGNEFVSREARIKAVFMLQYLLAEPQEYPEFELILNKLLTGYMQEQPLPRSVELSEDEREMPGSMLTGVMQNWDKMKNTTLQGFRDSFLNREGVLQEREEYWHLQVESRAYDMLLDTLPWGFSPVKYNWMRKPLMVDWR